MPVYETESGYRITYRVLPIETVGRLQAVAQAELAETRPPVPTQRVEIGPGEWREIENPDEEGYRAAKAAWERQVVNLVGVKIAKLMSSYALDIEIDEKQVQRLRAALDAVGAPIVGESDDEVMLWRIAVPGIEEQQKITGLVLGRELAAAVEAARARFRGNMARAQHLESADAVQPDAADAGI